MHKLKDETMTRRHSIGASQSINQSHAMVYSSPAEEAVPIWRGVSNLKLVIETVDENCSDSTCMANRNQA